MKIQRVDEDHFDVSNILEVLQKPRRYQGGYTSPTFVKSWTECPTRQVVSEIALIDKPKSLMTIIGTFVHLMFEHMQSDWFPEDAEDVLACWEKYSKPHHKQDYIVLDEADKEKVISEVLRYVNIYNDMDDYLKGSGIKLKDVWRTNKVQNEEFLRVEGFKKFGLELPTLMNLLDRLDFRGDEIYVIDYKTGDKNTGDYTLQMMIYSWAVQKIFGKKPRCLIISPGAPEKITEVTWSMRAESEAIEKILKADAEVKEAFATGEFPRRINQYCEYCPIAKDCLPGHDFAEFVENPEKLKK